jgi:hypothetical protein
MGKKHQKKRKEDSPSLGPEDADRLRSVLEDASTLDPASLGERIRTEPVALSFLENIPLEGPRTLEMVLAVQKSFPQKQVQKAAKKTLYRLKQRGIESPGKEGDSPQPFTIQPEEAPEPSAFVSPPDGLGTRAVFLMIPRMPAGVDLAMGMVSDEKGMIEFLSGRYSKKKAREVREVFSQAMGHLIETTLGHATTILEYCYSVGQSGPQTAAAGEYLKIRPWLLQNVTPRDTPPVYDLIPRETAGGRAPSPSQIQALMSHDWMKSWTVEPEAVRALVEEMQKAEASPILISAEQKTARKEDLREGFLSRYYTDERKKRLKLRLEEIAFLFQKEGEKEYARLALDAASSLDESSGFQVNPFLTCLVDRTLDYMTGLVGRSQAEAGKKTSEGPSGLILPR